MIKPSAKPAYLDFTFPALLQHHALFALLDAKYALPPAALNATPDTTTWTAPAARNATLHAAPTAAQEELPNAKKAVKIITTWTLTVHAKPAARTA
jgi:hypothetical protein